MKKIIYILSLVVMVFGFHSCSTDFDVIGEYQESTIVYGLLDQSQSLHMIKVNKSFLGPGNAYDYAVIRDSSEYDNLSGVVEEWINGSRTRYWTLKDTTLTDREEGVFYGPEYTAYYFVEPALNDEAEYRLILNINGGEREVTASTSLVNSFNFTYAPNTNPTSTIGFATFNSSTQVTTYNGYPIKWTKSLYGKRYDLSLRFNYDEYTATDTVRKYVDWFVGTEVISDIEVLNPSGLIEKEASGEAFYNNLSSKMDAPDASVLRRVVKGIDIIVSVASSDMYTYMIVNAPSSGLVQERPQFSNITSSDPENPAVGIFSARYNQSILNKKLSKSSLDELCNGAKTGHLGFCSDSIIYSAESFYCQ